MKMFMRTFISKKIMANYAIIPIKAKFRLNVAVINAN